MAKVELGTREAMFAIAFVFAIILTIALVNLGIITTPLTLGLIVTLATVMVLLGHILAQKGVLAGASIYIWYILTFGVMMLIYGAIYGGYLPIAFSYGASVSEVALSNALFYTLIIVAVVGAVLSVYFGYQYYKREAYRYKY